MATHRSCYCVNPHCSNRENVFHMGQTHCATCGTPLVLHPHQLLLTKPLYGYQRIDTNSEIFAVESLNLAEKPDYPQLLKILKSELGDKAKELFQQEGELLSQLRDTAVPRVGPQPYFQVPFYYPQTQIPMGSVHCLVMEQIQGPSLEQVLEQGKISCEQAIDWLRQLGQILLAVHRNQIIHRDIKPANIILREKEGYPHGELVLIDFGTARRNTQSYINKVAAEQSMTRITSPGYTAPEQCRGQYNFQSDLFAIGRTILHLLTDIYPDEQTYQQLDWSTLIPIVPLRNLLFTLTEENLKKRTANAEVLLKDISQLLDDLDRHPVMLWFRSGRRYWQWGVAIALTACSLWVISEVNLRLKSVSELYDLARQAQSAQQYERAARLYEMVIARQDETYNVYAHRELALTFLALQQLPAAMDLLEQAMTLGGPEEEVICRTASDLGRLQLINGNLQDPNTILQAHQAFIQALNCSATDLARAAGHRNFAASHYYLGDMELAQEHLQKSLEINEEDPKIQCLSELFKSHRLSVESTRISAINCLRDRDVVRHQISPQNNFLLATVEVNHKES